MSRQISETGDLIHDESGLLKAIVNAAEDSIFVKDLSFKYIMANPAMERLFDTTLGNIIGKTDDDLFGAEGGRHVMEADMRVILGSVVDEENTLPVKGVLKTFHVIKAPIRDRAGDIIGLCGIARDITTRKDMEDELKKAKDDLVRANRSLIETQSIYKTFAESAMDHIAVFDVDFNVLYINKAGAAGFRSTPDHVIGKNLKALIPAKPYGLMKATLQKAMDDKKTFVTEARINFHGTVKWQQAHILPIMDENDVIATMAITRDVTDYKNAEKALIEAKSRADLYVDLMSHDINNINQIAEGYVEIVMDGMGRDDERYELLSRSLNALKKSSRLIENVKKIQRSMSGDIKKTHVDIGKVLQEVSSEYGRLPGNPVVIGCTAPDGYLVVADELVYDIFSNLIDNAIKHSGGRARVDISILREARENKRYVSVYVEDYGPGIPDSMKATIFERFFSGSSRQKSRGLGLYLVRTLIDGYGGAIRVEDRVQGDQTKGTKFIVSLPSVE